MDTTCNPRFGAHDDVDAFLALWRDGRGRLLGVARRMTGGRADAEDVVQDAFCAAWRARAGYAGAAHPSTWLHRITVNAALMHLRRRRRRPTEALDALPECLFVDDGDDALAQSIHAEQREALSRALAALSPADRDVVLAEDGDDPCGGRGDGVTRSAWKSRRFRARRHLKLVLDCAGAPP
jgi:RNA polymerase sigma-70 factor (ECF subfamily)